MYADPGNCMSPVTEKEPRNITDKWFKYRACAKQVIWGWNDETLACVNPKPSVIFYRSESCMLQGYQYKFTSSLRRIPAGKNSRYLREPSVIVLWKSLRFARRNFHVTHKWSTSWIIPAKCAGILFWNSSDWSIFWLTKKCQTFS